MLDRAGAVRHRLRRREAASPGVVGELAAHETKCVPRRVIGEIRGSFGRNSKIPTVSQQVVQPDLQAVRPGRVAEWACVRPVQNTRLGETSSVDQDRSHLNR